MWYHHDTWGGDWLAMALGMAAVWLLVAAVLLLILWKVRPTAAEEDPQRILARRLARGEIGLDEYRTRAEALRGDGGGRPLSSG